jgi:hypothetical protein
VRTRTKTDEKIEKSGVDDCYCLKFLHDLPKGLKSGHRILMIHLVDDFGPSMTTDCLRRKQVLLLMLNCPGQWLQLFLMRSNVYKGG